MKAQNIMQQHREKNVGESVSESHQTELLNKNGNQIK